MGLIAEQRLDTTCTYTVNSADTGDESITHTLSSSHHYGVRVRSDGKYIRGCYCWPMVTTIPANLTDQGSHRKRRNCATNPPSELSPCTRPGACPVSDPQAGENAHDLMLTCNVEVKWDICNTREGTRRGSGCFPPVLHSQGRCIGPRNRAQNTIELSLSTLSLISATLRQKTPASTSCTMQYISGLSD